MKNHSARVDERRHIALIDDDRSLLRVFSAYLNDDYEVSIFSDPVRAAEAIQLEPFDLVISDIHMPGLDGLALRRHLSKDPSTDIVPFVFLTAQDGALIQERAALLGIDDYLVKPVKKAQLRRVVDRVLRRNARVVRASATDWIKGSPTACVPLFRTGSANGALLPWREAPAPAEATSFTASNAAIELLCSSATLWGTENKRSFLLTLTPGFYTGF